MKKICYIMLILFINQTAMVAQGPRNSSDEKEKKERSNPQTESQFFNSFVATNTINQFIYSGAPTGNDPFTIVKPKVKVQENIFLQKDWENRGTIKSLGGKQYTVGFINYELERGTFALQDKNSIFLIDGTKYREIIFNNASFKYFQNSLTGESRYYEIIAENDDFTLVKDNYLDIQQSGNNNNPGYTQNIETVYIKKTRYYIIKGDNFKSFKLKKSKILELTKDETKVASYAKKNKLSFRKTEDLKEIFTYSQTLN